MYDFFLTFLILSWGFHNLLLLLLSLDLFDDYCWVIGKETKLHFWYDNLIGSPLVKLLNLEDFIWDLDALALNFLDSDGVWHLPTSLDTYFPHISLQLRNYIMPNMIMISCFGSIHDVSSKPMYRHYTNHGVVQDWLYKIWWCYIPPSRSFLCWYVGFLQIAILLNSSLLLLLLCASRI